MIEISDFLYRLYLSSALRSGKLVLKILRNVANTSPVAMANGHVDAPQFPGNISQVSMGFCVCYFKLRYLLCFEGKCN
jgi:hypothetical protein